MAMASSLKDFILAALQEDQRIDGRRPFDSRRLHIRFAREDGGAEVQLGQTHVMCVVSGQLVQPYPERPSEGSLAVFTEFSQMADPTFEAGRPGESAVELGRVIDRGLRESRAVDTESLCVLAGKAVWSLRIDICILDNGGNLIDAASIAALAALLSFRRPECSIGGAEGQEVIIHPPEMREPLPLVIHFLPIAVTFAFFGDGEFVVVDPSFKEELVMRGRLTVIMNIHGDICAIQKGGGVGVTSSEIMRCLRIASTKAADVTASLKKAAETHEIERAQRKIKRHRNVSTLEIVKEITSAVVKKEEMTEVLTSATLLKKEIKYNIDARALEMLENEDSSSDDSDDDSDTEDEEVHEPVDTERISKQQVRKTVGSGHSKESLFKGGASQWQEDTKPSSSTIAQLFTTNDVVEFGEVESLVKQASVQAQSNQMEPAMEIKTSSVSVKLERVDIKSRLEGDSTQGAFIKTKDDPSASIKGSRPLSLLDAVKKENLKKKKRSGTKS